VYDPRLLNDRMLLGLKGTMSEFEIGILRQRAQEAYRQKVQRLEVMTLVPIGYDRCGARRYRIEPIHSAVALWLNRTANPPGRFTSETHPLFFDYDWDAE
jgi:hypothetical protein